MGTSSLVSVVLILSIKGPAVSPSPLGPKRTLFYTGGVCSPTVFFSREDLRVARSVECLEASLPRHGFFLLSSFKASIAHPSRCRSSFPPAFFQRLPASTRTLPSLSCPGRTVPSFCLGPPSFFTDPPFLPPKCPLVLMEARASFMRTLG